MRPTLIRQILTSFLLVCAGFALAWLIALYLLQAVDSQLAGMAAGDAVRRGRGGAAARTEHRDDAPAHAGAVETGGNAGGEGAGSSIHGFNCCHGWPVLSARPPVCVARRR